jgi:hypothetical protein
VGKRGKRGGHFCWSCGRVRPNEAFSGRGHTRHLCKECSKLGREELDRRQAVRDIERLVDPFRGVVPRRHRAAFQRFLAHPDERVRRHAEQIAADAARVREALRREREAEAEAEERWIHELALLAPETEAPLGDDSAF